ncbi:unnamed protein product [Pieris macdunnoughi]|uniref:Uncharacterized protein n=1 Tax=Pieris macdunnoughi TaxID=345717 RepID=A0A821L4I5_9NEOP|nr:unnamed protein product [Pieris macdunnoughi]
MSQEVQFIKITYIYAYMYIFITVDLKGRQIRSDYKCGQCVTESESAKMGDTLQEKVVRYGQESVPNRGRHEMGKDEDVGRSGDGMTWKPQDAESLWPE